MELASIYIQSLLNTAYTIISSKAKIQGNRCKKSDGMECKLFITSNKKEINKQIEKTMVATGGPIEVDDGFVIDITPLTEGYKRLTGDDLSDEGLHNMIITHSTEGD